MAINNSKKNNMILILIAFILLFIAIYYLISNNQQQSAQITELDAETAFKHLDSMPEIHIIAVLDNAKNDLHRRSLMNCQIDFASAYGYLQKKIEPFVYEEKYCYANIVENQTIYDIKTCERSHNRSGVFSIYIYPQIDIAQKNKYYDNKIIIYIPEEFNQSCVRIA